MSRSLSAKQVSLAAQVGELMFAAPWVVAHRMARFASRPGPDSAAEMRRMQAEKAEAAAESMTAMAMQASRSAQGAAASYMEAWGRAWMHAWFPWMSPGSRARFPAWGMTPSQVQHAAVDIASHGLAPVRRRAVANSRRLSKKR